MKSKVSRLSQPLLLGTLLSGALTLAAHAQTGEIPQTGGQANSSRWSLSAGSMVRSMNVDFNVPAPAPLNFRNFVQPRKNTGPGDVGFFTGGNPVAYSDGAVGPDAGFFFMPMYGAPPALPLGGEINGNGGEFLPPVTGLAIPNPGEATQFRSSSMMFSLDSTFTGDPFSVSDDETAASPYVALRYLLMQGGEAGPEVNFLLRYSWLGTEHGTGLRQTARQVVTETKKTSSFLYTYDQESFFFFNGNGGGEETSPIAPLGGIAESEIPLLIYDLPAFLNFVDGEGEGVAPSKSSSTRTSRSQAAEFVAFSRADLNVDLHEILFALELEQQVGPVSVSVAAGPTLNFINYDFATQTQWFQRGRSGPIAGSRAIDSGNEVKVGLMAQVAMILNLDPSGRVFMEVFGGYNWVDSFTVGAGGASAEIDPSSWTAGIGFGIHL